MKKVMENLLIIICVHIVIASWWVIHYFGEVNGDEMLFHLLVPLNGVNSDCFLNYFLLAIIPTIIIVVLLKILLKKIIKLKKKKLFYVGLTIVSLSFMFFELNLDSYIDDQIKQSNFIKENYIETKNVKLKFPDTKRNLIFIFLESTEVTYSSKDDGGIRKENLIPNLTKVAKENISFSNSRKMGGALGLNGSSWTVASMVSHTSGLPLKINFSSNGIIDFENFMSNVTTIGDILEENGYENYLIAGSDTNYGARKVYFQEHGDYNIYDVNSALNDKKIKEKVWWGFDDDKLFSIAKEQLLEISQKEEPFNYTMLTVDTHFEDGYLANTCETKFNDYYADVIYCSDKRISNFLDWLKEQDFYKNTTVVLVGDHKSMDTDFFNNVPRNYMRTNYNAFINSVSTTDNLYNRQFTALDLFPTTLASLGVEIENNKLALGVNLFSEEKTLVEEYGYNYVFNELNKRSTFYNNNFLAYK